MMRKINQIFDARALQSLVENSYEDAMTRLNNAVIENEKLFGRNATLLATHPDSVIVVNENGQVLRAKYSIKESRVRFGKKTELEVPVVTQESITRRAVDGFFDGGSLAEGIKGLVAASLSKEVAPLDEAKSELDILFSQGILWRGFIRDNLAKMSEFAFDPKYGSPKIEDKIKFEKLYGTLAEDEELEDHRDEVMTSLVGMAKRLSKLFVNAKESYRAYKARAGNKNESEVFSHFKAFSEDYIEDVERVADFISESIRNGESNCVACLAFVHDEVARRATEFELGERLIRKVSNEFAQ